MSGGLYGVGAQLMFNFMGGTQVLTPPVAGTNMFENENPAVMPLIVRFYGW